MTPPHQELKIGDVHIHLLFPESLNEKTRQTYLSFMNAAEKEKLQTLTNQKVKEQYLLSRGMVREILSRYTKEEPQSLNFSLTQLGKPELTREENQPKLRFNLSHTAGLIACAVTLDADLGIDVENTERTNATIDIAKRFFSPLEFNNLRELPAGEQKSRFFDYWTLKEAYIKARGDGLTLPLSKFSFSIGEDLPGVFFEQELQDDASCWHFQLFSPSSRHRMAIAVKKGTTKVAITTITPSS